MKLYVIAKYNTESRTFMFFKGFWSVAEWDYDDQYTETFETREDAESYIQKTKQLHYQSLFIFENIYYNP